MNTKNINKESFTLLLDKHVVEALRDEVSALKARVEELEESLQRKANNGFLKPRAAKEQYSHKSLRISLKNGAPYVQLVGNKTARIRFRHSWLGKRLITMAYFWTEDAGGARVLYSGFSVCCPKDQYNRRVGNLLSVSRLQLNSVNDYTLDTKVHREIREMFYGVQE